VTKIVVAGRDPLGDPPANQDFGYHWLEYFGIPADGFDFTLQLDAKTKLELSTITRFIGLPHIQGFNGFPPGIIPGPEGYSNATFVLRRFSF
jgi:hypothetical protein